MVIYDWRSSNPREFSENWFSRKNGYGNYQGGKHISLNIADVSISVASERIYEALTRIV